MQGVKTFFIDLLENPVKIFMITVLIKLCSLGVGQTFVILGLPEIASEADNLSQSQIWTGFLLGIASVILNLISFILNFLFTISLMYSIYRIIKPVGGGRNR